MQHTLHITLKGRCMDFSTAYSTQSVKSKPQDDIWYVLLFNIQTTWGSSGRSYANILYLNFFGNCYLNKSGGLCPKRNKELQDLFWSVVKQSEIV